MTFKPFIIGGGASAGPAPEQKLDKNRGDILANRGIRKGDGVDLYLNSIALN